MKPYDAASLSIIALLAVFFGSLTSCGANAPAGPEGPLPATVQAVADVTRTFNNSPSTAPSVTIVEVKGGTVLVSFGYYSSPDKTVIVAVDPGQPTRLLYPVPPAPVPVIAPLWYGVKKP